MYKKVLKNMPESDVISISYAIDELNAGKLLLGTQDNNWYMLKRNFAKSNDWKWYMLFTNMYNGDMNNDVNNLDNYIRKMDKLYLLSDMKDLQELLNTIDL